MTLNSVIKRINVITSAHKQIRSFLHNVNIVEWLNGHTDQYPAAFLQDNSGNISTKGHATTLGFKLFLVDLVNVSGDTKANELDVQSDMLGVAQDLIAQFNRPENDWMLSPDNNVQQLVEGENSLYAGVVVTFTIRYAFTQNICSVPTTFDISENN